MSEQLDICRFCSAPAGNDSCCIENIWAIAGKELDAGTMTQDKMDKLMYMALEKDGGFQCMKCDEDEIIDTDKQPIKLDLYQCPKCDKIDTFSIISGHIPDAHTDDDGVYEE